MNKYILLFLALFLFGCQEDVSIKEVSIEIETESYTPLPDAVTVVDHGIEFVLTDPTDEYAHGVLGDKVEAGSLTIIDGDKLTTIDFSPKVFEGLFPLIVDLDSDGEKEIVATLSDAESGAQLVAYDFEGNKIASSEAIGAGYRWRHALTVAPFGPNGEIELVDVLMPHLKQEVEFFQMNGDKLEKVAGIESYSTHTIGSRNLNLFAVLEEEGRYLLIVPTPDFKSIAAIQRVDGGAEEVWRIEIGETIESIDVEDGELYVNGVLEK